MLIIAQFGSCFQHEILNFPFIGNNGNKSIFRVCAIHQVQVM